jgi:hypothetical protein
VQRAHQHRARLTSLACKQTNNMWLADRSTITLHLNQALVCTIKSRHGWWIVLLILEWYI